MDSDSPRAICWGKVRDAMFEMRQLEREKFAETRNHALGSLRADSDADTAYSHHQSVFLSNCKSALDNIPSQFIQFVNVVVGEIRDNEAAATSRKEPLLTPSPDVTEDARHSNNNRKRTISPCRAPIATMTPDRSSSVETYGTMPDLDLMAVDEEKSAQSANVASGARKLGPSPASMTSKRPSSSKVPSDGTNKRIKIAKPERGIVRRQLMHKEFILQDEDGYYVVRCKAPQCTKGDDPVYFQEHPFESGQAIQHFGAGCHQANLDRDKIIKKFSYRVIDMNVSGHARNLDDHQRPIPSIESDFRPMTPLSPPQIVNTGKQPESHAEDSASRVVPTVPLSKSFKAPDQVPYQQRVSSEFNLRRQRRPDTYAKADFPEEDYRDEDEDGNFSP